IVPTFETQKLARTYILDIPAPRGQVTDRNGAPLAQNQLSYNLAINFPTPLEFNDAETLDFAHRQIAAATKLIGRPIRAADDAIPTGSSTITKQFGRRRRGVKESNKPSMPCSRASMASIKLPSIKMAVKHRKKSSRRLFPVTRL